VVLPTIAEQAIAREILAGRRNAAMAGLYDLRETIPWVDWPLVESAWEREVARAERAARGLVQGLRRHVELAGLEDVEVAAADSARWVRNRAELTAATESAEAFNDSRIRSLDDIGRRDPWATLELFKVWDSELDKQTCPVCERAHGTIVRIDEDFPDGTPGGVHPRCRCTSHVLTRDEL
jgi:SPP1 gp7 family putative phage head morphogenesis protein